MHLDMTEAENHRLSYWKCNRNVEHLYIGGGYLRDSLLGRAVKDIDVYLYLTGGWERNESMIIDLVKQGKITQLGTPYDSSMFHFIGESKGGRINMIFPKIPMASVVASYDINLCKVFYNVKTDTLYQRSGFLKDAKNKTITVNSLYHHSGHLKRVMEKYPEYSVQGESPSQYLDRVRAGGIPF